MQHSTQVILLSKKALSLVAVVLSAVFALALSVCLGAPKIAYADPTAAEKQAEAESVLANLNSMQETLDRLAVEYGEALAAQEQAEASRDAAEARLTEINEQIADLRERLNERARDMYRNGSISYLEILLGAGTFEDFATNWDLLNKVNENDTVMVQMRKDLAAEAEQQAAVFNEQAIVASEKAEEAAQAEAQAEATMAEMQATYESLSAEAERLLEEERKAREAEEAARVAAVMAEAAAAAERQAAAQAASGATSGGATTETPAASGGSNASTPAPSPASDDSGSSEETPAATVEETPAPVEETPSASYEGGSDTVSRAYACLGAPYVWGGVGPGGYDCSGLVSYCLTGSHSRLGTTYTFMGWPMVADPQPGDIAVNYSHTGIYIGDGQMIHAATYGVGVIIGPVQSGMIFVRYGG